MRWLINGVILSVLAYVQHSQVVALKLVNNNDPITLKSVSIIRDEKLQTRIATSEDLSKYSPLARATFDDKMLTYGWGELKVQTLETSPESDEAHMFAAGYAEGYLTSSHIYDHFQNMYKLMYSKGLPEPIQDFMKIQLAWARSQVAANENDMHWMQLGLILAHFDGLVAGYNANTPASKALTVEDLYFLNSLGDMLDLHVANVKNDRPDWLSMSKSEFFTRLATTGHCSALIRATADLSDVYIAHSSWFSYSAMNRIFKHYDFPTKHTPGTSARKVSFSSYPGMLSSLDDFYIMSSGLAMVQTTNNVFNNDLFDKVVPQSLFAWQRVRLACTTAKNGKEWAETIKRHNSGTYNNQYMVFDSSKFVPKVEIQDGGLFVVEQIPGYVKYADVTAQLRTGHWPSYNVPYFEDIYTLSGYPEIVHAHGIEASYQMAPRATIFRRDAGFVEDMAGMKKIMRSNGFETDPLSHHDPANAICSRMDLRGADSASPNGCYDTKITAASLLSSMTAEAINGPTTNDDILPPFKWDQFGDTYPHQGLAETYNFPFITVMADWEAFERMF